MFSVKAAKEQRTACETHFDSVHACGSKTWSHHDHYSQSIKHHNITLKQSDQH